MPWCVQFAINKCEYDSHVPFPPEYDVSRGDTYVLLLSEFSFEGFSSETTRSMVAMMDVSLTTAADFCLTNNCSLSLAPCDHYTVFCC